MRRAAMGEPSMFRQLCFVACGLVVLAATVVQARACEGSEVIFEDKFSDDAWGWTLNNTVQIKDGTFIKLAPDDLETNLNVTFTVDNADICSEVVWPEGYPVMLVLAFCSGAWTTRIISSSGFPTAANIGSRGNWTADGRPSSRTSICRRSVLPQAPPIRSASRPTATPRHSISTAPRSETFAASRPNPDGALGSPATISTRKKRPSWSSKASR